MINISHVSYRYVGPRDLFELGPLSLEIEPAQLTFWVGHNGSGKSTLARILCSEITPDFGSIAGLRGSAVYHHQSVMDNIFPDLTIGEHMRLIGHKNEQRAGFVKGKFPEIDSLLSKYPDELSGGQLQLAAFITLLLTKHTLYVFDEVLNHLDMERAKRVLECIREVLAIRERAHCVVITHDLALVQSMADVVHVFSQGTVIRSFRRSDLDNCGSDLISLLMKSEVKEN